MKLCNKKKPNATKSADGLKEARIHSLTAGGAYGAAEIQYFLGYCGLKK